MHRRDIGSVVVTDGAKVVGILTERDLLRAAAARADPLAEPVRLVDDRRPRRARPRRGGGGGLGRPDPPPLPPPPGGGRRGAGRGGVPAGPPGRGPDPAGRRGRRATCRRASRGWWWPRRPSATSAARRASSTTGSTRPSSWPPPARSRTCGSCCSTAPSPTPPAGRPSPPRWPPCRRLPDGLAGAAARRWPAGDVAPRRPAHRRSPARRRAGLAARPTTSTPASCGPRPSACAPWCPPCSPPSTGCRHGLAPVPPRDRPVLRRQLPVDAAGARRRRPEHVRAVEQYLILTIDHGFNASTFTARVITSTGADLAAAVVGAIGALSGPAPRRGPEPGPGHARRDRHPRPGRGRGSARRWPGATGSWASATASTRPTTPARSSSARWPGRLGGPWWRLRRGGGADRGRRAGRAQARPPALHQRRVLRRGGDAHLRHPPGDVHPHLRLPAGPSGGRPT